MKIAFYPVHSKVSRQQIDRAEASIRYRYPHEPPDYFCKTDDYIHFKKTQPERQWVKDSDRGAMGRYEVLVYLEYQKEIIPTTYSGFSKTQKVYKIDYLGKLYRCGPLDDSDYPHFDSHVFNRVGPRVDDNFCYFPYTYLYRLTGLGPTNPFGHRIREDLESFKTRSANTRLICVFGGSSAWSIYTFYEEMFSHQLETLLNEAMSKKGSALSFKVLNFGMQSNTALSEMMAYLLWAYPLKPDIVIAHDGKLICLARFEREHPELAL